MKKFFLLFFLFCNFIFPNNQIKNLVKTGLNYAYNFQIEKAFDVFDDIIKKYPNEPEGYHYKSTIYLWFYLSNNEAQNFNNFMSLSNQAIELANQKLKDEKDIEESKFILGLNYGFRGMTFGKAERYLEMIWAFKESYSNLEEVIKLNPNNFDAYLGLGLFKFTLDQIPSAFQWALDVIGFSGDISTGLNYLKIASEKGDLVKTEAQFYLSQIYKDFYFDYDQSYKLLRILKNKFPNNELFQYSYAVIEINRKNLFEAERTLLKIIKKKNSHFPQVISYTEFLLGDINFKKNKFNDAKKYYLNFLSTTKLNDYQGIANYRLGLCFEFNGNVDSAKIHYENAVNSKSNLEDDIFARRKSSLLLTKRLSDDEKNLITYSNIFETGNYKVVYDYLKNNINDFQTPELKSEAYFLLCKTCYELHKFDEAINYSNLSVKQIVKNEKWIKPFCEIYAIKSNLEIGDTTKVKTLIAQAENYKDFDYENKFKRMMESIKLSLKN